MARANDYVDPDYDRRLAEYKALKAKIKQQGTDQFSQNQNQAQGSSSHQSQNQNNSQNSQHQNSSQEDNSGNTKRVFRY